MKIKKMKTMKILLLAAIFSLLIPSLLIAEEAVKAAVAVKSAAAEVQVTVDELVKIVESNGGEDNTVVRRQKMRELINPRFDFEEMSRRCLGLHWRDINPEQRKEFSDIFSELLARTYLSRVENVRAGMVEIVGETTDFPRATVKTKVEHKGDIFPIDYKLIHKDGTWRVYDVLIENIGLVANYRNEFSGIIRREKFEGLMARLKEKHANLKD